MYTTYFGFQEEPFSLTPTSRLFYTNPVYEAAYARLLEGIRGRKGFMVLTGEVGTGKTTLLRRLMDHLLEEDPTVSVAFSYYSILTFEEFLSFVCEDFKLTVKGEGYPQEIQAFTEFLLTRSQEGGTTALLIDEAQDLEEEVLENFLWLSHPQPAGETLLQVILVGQQPELEEKLSQPRLSQLKQRIAFHCQLEHLKTEEVNTFIHHRLRLVGYKRQDLFSPESIQLITSYSKGIPRLINLLCDNALQATYEASRKTISAQVIQKVAYHLQLEESKVAQLETPEGETLLRSRDNIPSQELADAPPRRTPRRSLWGGDETLAQASQPLKTGLRGRIPRFLAWGVGAGVLLTPLGLFILTSRVTELKQIQVPSELQVFDELSPQPQQQQQNPELPSGQPVTLTKQTESMSSAPAPSPSDNPHIIRGKAVLEHLAEKYQAVQPMVWGLTTANPAIALLIPKTQWRKLSKEEQVSLSLYLEGLIPAVRAHPDHYIEEFRAAPLYETFRTKIASLCGDCWLIGLGHLTGDAKSLLFDEVLVQGDSLWEKAPPHDRGVKASAFRAALNASQIKPLERKARQGVRR
jgi:general secretion pathway protein A